MSFVTYVYTANLFMSARKNYNAGFLFATDLLDIHHAYSACTQQYVFFNLKWS